jgi:hypothetical protein
MLKTFVVVILAVLLCGCTMGLRCIVVMFRRLGVRLLHCYSFRLPANTGPTVGTAIVPIGCRIVVDKEAEKLELFCDLVDTLDREHRCLREAHGPQRCDTVNGGLRIPLKISGGNDAFSGTEAL